jgi:hypothetical protein
MPVISLDKRWGFRFLVKLDWRLCHGFAAIMIAKPAKPANRRNNDRFRSKSG